MLFKLTITQALLALSRREITCSQLVQSYIDNAVDAKKLNSFITVNFESALQQAKISDAKWENNTARPLEGLPMAIKDCFCTKGILTSCASKMLENFVPPYNATVVNKLVNDSGVIIIGKTNLDEFCMGSKCTTSYYGPTINPWIKEDNVYLTPGGSSGGSAVAVSAELAIAATGTDAGGSIRQPAAFTHTVGLKPTYGRVSRHGIVTFSPSLDHIGCITKNVEDSATMLYHMAGKDILDATSLSAPVDNYLDFCHKGRTEGIEEIRIGIIHGLEDTMSQELLSMWNNCTSLLKCGKAELVDINLPHAKFALAAYHIITSSECLSNLARYDGIHYGFRAPTAKNLEEIYRSTRRDGFGKEAKRRIMFGASILSAEGKLSTTFTQAHKVSRIITQEFRDMFQQVDIMLLPTVLTAPFPIDKQCSPLADFMNDYLTVPASIAGVPVISIPAGFTHDNLPLGIQIISNHLQEGIMFQVATFLEYQLNLINTNDKQWWRKNHDK